MEPDRPLNLLTNPPINAWDSSEMLTWELCSLGRLRKGKRLHTHTTTLAHSSPNRT